MTVFDGSFFPVKDFAKSTVATAPSPADTGTSLVVATGEGALFPTPSTQGAFRAYVWPTGTKPDSTNCEEVEITAISTDTFTIVRQKSGIARSILVGDNIAINFGKSKEDQIITAIKDGVFEDKLLPSESYSRDSITQFKTPGDKTGWYTAGRIIRVNNAGSYSTHRVVRSSYSAPDTTVITTDGDLPATLTNIYIAIQPKGKTIIPDYMSEGLTAGITKMERVEMGTFTTHTTVNLATITGEGCINMIWIALNGAELTKDSVLKIYVDGEGTPSIEIDVGSLGTHWVSGNYRGNDHVSGEISSDAGSAGYALRFKIPYSNGVVVDIYNPTSYSGYVWGQVFYTTDYSPPYRLKSKAVTWLSRPTVTAGGSYTFIDLDLNGWLVWHSMIMKGASNETYMESDVNFYIDGEGSPSISHTGTEDYFLSSFYFFDTAFHRAWMFGYRDATNKVMAAALDLLKAYGGIKFNSHLKVILDASESTTNFDMSYIMLYYVNV